MFTNFEKKHRYILCNKNLSIQLREMETKTIHLLYSWSMWKIRPGLLVIHFDMLNIVLMAVI